MTDHCRFRRPSRGPLESQEPSESSISTLRAPPPGEDTTQRPTAQPPELKIKQPTQTRVAEGSRARRVVVEDLHASYGANEAVKGVNLEFPPNEVTAIIGPSGCGKSTLIRCINRMHEEIPGTRVTGRVMLDGQDLYSAAADPVAVRAVVGMVFQKPNPFPTMSVYDNVAAGLRLGGRGSTRDLGVQVERALRGASLWEEVKDSLQEPGVALSGGQQQRLCIARTIAVEPEVILMDEPCSALDPVATLKIEELIAELKTRYTIAIVTHNMQQAARVADSTAFMLSGEMVEHAPTDTIFTKPSDKRTEDYVTGRFG